MLALHKEKAEAAPPESKPLHNKFCTGPGLPTKEGLQESREIVRYMCQVTLFPFKVTRNELAGLSLQSKISPAGTYFLSR